MRISKEQKRISNVYQNLIGRLLDYPGRPLREDDGSLTIGYGFWPYFTKDAFYSLYSVRLLFLDEFASE